ncbi:MAG: DUF1624 domain-containing protein [Ignavibacteria bacterium]|nr:DUF1624 domain-containing protein [Ignavibacteria bacterium]
MTKIPRYNFLDLYRGLFVLLMIEGHTIRTVLEGTEMTTRFFDIHEMIHGVTGPGFLFGAGFAFAIATLRRWDFLRSLNVPFLRRTWRAMLLILVGYALHLPYYSLSKLINDSVPWQLDEFFAFGVLQCIGFTLLGLRIQLFVLKEETPFLITTGTILFLTIFGSPLLWTPVINESLPRFIAQGLNGLSGSHYPLFPYSGYMLAGVLVSWLFIRQSAAGEEQSFMRRLALSGGGLILLSLILSNFFMTPTIARIPYASRPGIMAMYLGILCVLMSTLWYLENVVISKEGSAPMKPAWLVLAGLESFFLYITHLIVVYGWIFNPRINLRYFWENQFSWFESFLAFVVVSIILIVAAKFWRHLKREHPVMMLGLYWWMAITFMYYFITNPF